MIRTGCIMNLNINDSPTDEPEDSIPLCQPSGI